MARNIHDVLKQKELQLEHLQKEIEALRLAARLLEEPEEVAVGAGARSGNNSSSPRDGGSSSSPRQFP